MSSDNPYRGLDRESYIRLKYKERGIDTDATTQPKGGFSPEIWWNAVTIRPEIMANNICAVCQSDCIWFNPRKHVLATYETRPYVPPAPGEKRRPKVPPGKYVLCSKSCLWWDWASERRRQMVKNHNKANNKK
jgi:hypothetical protein